MWSLAQGVSIMASMQKRLQKELMALQNDPPPGMTLNEKSVQNSITQWIVDMEGAPGTLYEGEKFQLLFKFSSRYPFDSPQRRPPDNSFYVRTCNKNPKKTKWWYHDIKLNTHQLSLTLPHENLQVSKSQDPKSKERRCNMRNNHSWLSQWPALSCQSGCSTKPRILMLNSDTAVHTPGWVTDNYCTLRIIRNTCTSCAVSMQA
ncbi:uncharacterized protein [Narcine bancroftii]|uniref:uncharacterized protein isoform X3 n=1 Tax=Narcine bancroftii TaxID=1343680 RepID=UPI003831259F